MSDDIELTFDESPVATKPCPECNEDMELRRNAATGNYFWGCTSYPDCPYTEPENGVWCNGHDPYEENEAESAEWRNFEVF